MFINFHREKLINAVIYFVKNTKMCGITKLVKLLSFLDFKHFKETGKSVTGLEYFAWEYGPVPKDLWNEISNGAREDLAEAVSIRKCHMDQDREQYAFKVKKKFNGDYFSPRETRILKEMVEIFKDVDTKDMVNASHEGSLPWFEIWQGGQGEGDHIDYMLAIRGKAGLSREEALNRKEEIAEMHENFGVV